MNNKKVFAIIGVVLVIAIVGIFAFNSNKKTPETPTTEGESQVVSEDTQNQKNAEPEAEAPVAIESVTVSQDQLNKIVYSDFIGSVNGTRYANIAVGSKVGDEGYYNAASDNPVIPRLSVEAEGYITSFAQYGDYVYYVITESSNMSETYSVYRCKTDFTEQELLVKNEPVYDDGTVEITYNFIIDDGKLCSIPYETVENNKYQCIDLETKEITYEARVDYNGLNGVQEEESVVIYNGKAFFINNQNQEHKDKIFAYHLVDGKRVALKDDTITEGRSLVNICGYADGYVYYYESFNAPVDGANSLLKRYNLADNTVELLDKRVIGGGSSFFQEYSN